MAKLRCPNCKEFPYRWTTVHDLEGWRGKECSLCNHIRTVKRRASPKRDARNARHDALIAELLGREV